MRDMPQEELRHVVGGLVVVAPGYKPPGRDDATEAWLDWLAPSPTPEPRERSAAA